MTNEAKSVGCSTLLVERRDKGLLVVTLNRPDQGNAPNTQMCIDLLGRLAECRIVSAWDGVERAGAQPGCAS